MRIIGLAILLALPGITLSAQAQNRIVTQAVNGFVRPAYHAFAEGTGALVPALDTLCKAHGSAALASARAAFTKTMVAWSEVETIRIGPVTQDNRQDRILHWPDRKGIGLKQVQAALANEDPTATEAARLAQKSIAMQGLGALEFVLFGAGADEAASWSSGYRCHYGAAIAGNLDLMAKDIAAEWDAPDGFAGSWENPGPQNNLYRNNAESLNDLMDIFVQGTEMVRDVRLNGFLGEAAGQDKPKQAIYWRSNGTADSLASNITGLEKLFDASHLADLATGDNAYLAGSIDFEFGNAEDALAAIRGKPIDAVLADEGGRSKLAYFRVVTSSLSDLFGARLSDALGLTAGFSSLDGD